MDSDYLDLITVLLNTVSFRNVYLSKVKATKKIRETPTSKKKKKYLKEGGSKSYSLSGVFSM